MVGLENCRHINKTSTSINRYFFLNLRRYTQHFIWSPCFSNRSQCYTTHTNYNSNHLCNIYWILAKECPKKKRKKAWCGRQNSSTSHTRIRQCRVGEILQTIKQLCWTCKYLLHNLSSKDRIGEVTAIHLDKDRIWLVTASDLDN